MKDFTLYPEALELKQLGFDEPCLGYYFGNDREVYISNEDVKAPFTPSLDSKVMFRAPTYSQAFRWFREKYKFQTYIDFYHSQSYFYKIKSQEGKVIGKTGDVILQGTPLFTRTYEDAELNCLKKLIEIVKEGYND